MEQLVISIIQNLFPSHHDKIDRLSYSLHESYKEMFIKLCELEKEEIIRLYDVVVHNKRQS